jgi:hypothetical protein
MIGWYIGLPIGAADFEEAVPEIVWYQPLATPVLVSRRLGARYQLAFSGSLRPITITTGAMAATETGDTALFDAIIVPDTAPVLALVGIIEMT